MPIIDASKEHHSLRERLCAAETEREIDALLQEGENYEGATQRTRNRWRNAAKKRREEVRK